MSEVEFLLHLQSLGVKLWLEGEAVKFSAPRGALTPELKDELKARKEAIRHFLLEAARMAGDGQRAPIAAVPRDQPLPLSFGQERLWFLALLEPDSAAYVIPAALRLDGPIDPAALQRALNEIVRRHEALRITFSSSEGKPVAVLHESVVIPLPITDLSVFPPEERELALRREVAAESRRAFDLAAGPLLRARLIRLGPEEHVLVSAMHHIVSDGWSTNVFARELGTLYDAFVAGKPSPLAELPIQYADFAAWQRGVLAGDNLDRQLAYWKARLGGAPAALLLPTDRPRPPLPSFRGSWRRFALSPELSEALRDLAQREGVTLFMLLLAALDVLLARTSGQDDVVVGSPIAGRTRPETEPLIGFFVNTLVLRARLASDAPFRAFLAQVKETCLGAYAHQDMPFERLVQELSPQRDPSRSPLFQVLFSLQNAGHEGVALTGVRRRGMAVDSGTAKFDLTLAMAEGPRGLHGVIEYATDLFDAATVDRMASHLGVLLEGIARDPSVSLENLPILGDAEREQLLVTWNATALPYPRVGAHRLVEAQVDRSPEAIAVACAGREITFRALDRRSNQLARALQKRGAGPGVRIGISVERSIDMVVAALAVLKSGAAYVPLDPMYPKDRLAFMAADAALPILLTQASLAAELAGLAPAQLRLDADAATIAEESDARLEDPIDPESTAYVIYTSGSTGKPKGVRVPHRALASFLTTMAIEPGFGASDRLLAVTSLSFDIAGLELFLPLTTGGRVEIASGAAVADGAALARLLTDGGITVMQATPSTWRLLFAAGWQGGAIKVLVGGEAVPRELVDKLVPRVASVWNMYGPTETTIWSCVQRLAADGGVVPIGRPIGNTQVYVLDRARNPVPVGVAGELHLGGDGVALGYHERPELTAERFIASPFVAGATLYKTGDLCRFRDDGALEFLGRLDFQVKIRGFRVELGEIEAALAAHPSVRQAVVAAREDTPGDQRLVGYLVVDAPIAAGELRALLKLTLPDYMVPAAFVVLDALPLTANGKVDRQALPAPDAGAAEEKGHVAPRGPVEEVLVGIFAEVLHLTEVSAEADFFALGGHSLLATQIMARIRAAFGVELPLRTLFEATTPAELAVQTQAALGAERGALPPPLVTILRDGPRSLSFAEERLWFLDQLQPGDASYVVSLPIYLTGALDAAALHRTLAEVVRRHEILRTTFPVVDGHAVAIIHPSSDVALAETSLTTLPAEQRSAAARAEIAAEASRPFDLAAGPLFRARLLVLAAEDHVLLLAMHHIVTDGWSLGVLDREIAVLYAAFSRGEPSPLRELPIQYADYAAWQRAWLAGDVLDAQLAYWKQHLGDAPRTLDLPTDRPRPPVQTHRGARAHFTVPDALATSLRALARREGATLFMTLLAAFDVLLHRYTGQDDLVVGTPIANRTRTETEGLIGFFVNTTVLRARLPEDLTFGALLAQVKETCLGAYAHQDMPFERLVQELDPERDASRSPLFQAMFLLQNAARAEAALPGVKRRELGTPTVTAKFELMLTMVEGRSGLAGAFEYNVDLFDAATIERMGAHLGAILAEIARDPSVKIGEIALLDEAERRQILVAWNDTARPIPEGLGLQQLFEQQAARTPDAVAVVAADESVTYRELDRRANQLARYLARLGVGEGALVGVAMERAVDLVVALVGVLKAGAAYVPIDPSYPKDRVAAMLDDAQATVILTQARLVAGLVVPAATRLVAVDAEPSIAAESDLAPAWPANPDSLAYVIFTSGSTGRPKGVMIPHRAVVNHMIWMHRRWPLGPGDAVLQKTPVSFDASVWELWAPLVGGARLELALPDLHGDPAYLVRAVIDRGITDLQLVPSVLDLVVQEPGFARCTSLRRLYAGGEALSRALVERVQARLDVEIINLYGPTEVTIQSVVWVAERGPTMAAMEPIGRPIDNLRAYVLDARRQPAPIGVPGELYLGGAGVGRGYLGQPALTAERFLASPFVEGDRLYRTGDLCRFRADGVIEYLGRVDHQVKIRGFRIELGEIEVVLEQHPGVREATVVAREDTPGDRRLVAYVVSEGEAPRAEDLRAHLAAKLPAYMVPWAFVALPRMPLMANGKIDRRALPAPDADAAGDRAHVAPRGPVEEAIAGVFADVLQIDAVGAHDGFFALGGHSLLATQAIARVRAAFGVELPLRALFESTTPAELAIVVQAALAADRGAPPPPLVAVGREGPRSLSFAEERLWFLDQLQPGDASYLVPLPIHLAGALDAAALHRALAEVVRRHEILRTTFTVVDGRPVAVIHPSSDVALTETSLTTLPAEQRNAAARAEIAAEASRPFDLAAGPLFRARLLVLGAEDHVLLLALHHIVTDGWSLGVLDREIAALYAAFSRGEPSPLRELPIQYADYAAWQRAWLAGDVLSAQLAYWKQHLGGAPRTLDLPTDRPRPPVQTYGGARCLFTVPAAAAKSLAELSRREGATLFMALLAAFDVLLHRYTGQDDLVVGTPIANRTRTETEGLIGFFVNTTVLRARLPADLTFRALLAQVKETCLGAYAHQDMPFERLVQELEPERDASRSPLFQAMFVLQNIPKAAVVRSGVKRREIGTPTVTAKFDLLLTMSDGPSGLAGGFEYNVDLFDAATIERMASHLVALLEGVVRDPEALVGAIPICGEAERQRVVVDWNRTATDYPRDASLPALFAAEAARRPDAVALVFGDEALTYRELDRRSSRLANALVRRGVAPGDKVALHAPRSIAMVVATLAILKAGGAYVPLEPSYPIHRLAFMLQDTAAKVVVAVGPVPDALPLGGAALLRLDHEAAAIAAESDTGPVVARSGESLAYVMYTSGSTGAPKGVCVLDRGVVRLVVQTDYASFDADEVFLQLAPVAFDAATLEIWGPLLNGGRLVVAPAEAPSLAEIGALIRAHGITTLWLTTGLFNAMVDGNVEALRPLRQLLTGGDVASVPHMQKALAELPGVRLINGYGPTEGTTFTTCHAVSFADTMGAIPIGRPIANTRVYVLDAAMQPVPVGVPGELFVGGDGVARGYLDRPELTAERFVADPFGPGRLYRTGDLVRWRADGAIAFLGRLDQQVKLRGFRIELGEIEAALAKHPAVRDVTVIVREDAPGDKRLIAYLVTASAAPSQVELAAHLKERLPEYMVPSAFVTVATIPLTANGKVDRRALPAPDAATPEAREHTAARGPVEEGLAGIFAEVLKVGVVGAHDGFFELGGHSLLATQAIGRIRGAFGVDLPLRALFEAPTPAALAVRIDAALRADRGVLPPPIVPVAKTTAPLLSFGQERLWFLDQLEPGDPSYIVPQVLRFEGALDRDALARALAAIVDRHEVLRTTFTSVDGRPAPVVHPAVGIPLVVTSLRDLPADDRAVALRREAAKEARSPFDLRTGPVIRARLLELADDDHALLLTMHHIVSDAWSLGVMNREIFALYQAFTEGRPSPLPDLPIQYGDYAHWQRGWFTGEALQQQLDHVKGRLAGAPRAIELPTDRPRPPVESHRGSTINFSLTPALGQALQDLARREGATLFMTLLAAFDALLHRITGQSDLVIGSPIAGRTRIETERMIGFFLNTLVLRAQLSSDLSFSELLARVKESCLDAYANQDLPFERLVQELAPERDLSRSPIFQVMFVLQNAPTGGAAAPTGLKLRGAPVDSGTAKFDLTLGMSQRADGGLTGALEYATDLFDASTIERILGYFRLLLEGIVRDPSTALFRLPLLPAEERERLVVTWNQTAADFPRDTTVHALFEAQAARTPDAIAVSAGSKALSYRALDEQANQLASYLQRRGVGPEVLVGICTRRSLALVVAILGVLKAGGAYVPMDPEYPKERLAFLLEDAAAPVLLTEASLVAALPASKAEIVRLDADWGAIAREPTSPVDGGAGSESLAYVIYTSGSTGKPKGAMLVHRGVVNYLTWAIQAYRVAEGEGSPLHSSIGFDLTVTSLFTPLLSGKCVTLVPEGQGIDALAEALRAGENQSLVKITPAHLEVLSQQLAPAEAANRTRSFIIGGEALLGKSLAFFQAHAPATRLINEYGPTETVVGCCVHEVTAGQALSGAVPIGRPIANTQLYVLDPHLQPVPTGVVGEIYIGGVQVGRGYLNRPDLTAERFLPDPFGPPGARLYRTGDLARHLPSGELEYLGRIDHQVKIRGYRIELGEIEAVLARHPALREIAVLAREDVPGQKRLVAYLACAAEAAPTVAELRAFLKDTLPEYMIPAVFVVQSALPLTTNGKVDRAALPSPEQGAEAALGEEFVAARTAIEEELTRIWKAVLRRKQVGIHDNFFSIGGDSILSIQVVSRAQQAGLTITPRQMFQRQTIAELAEVAGQGRVVVSAEQGLVTGAAPLTPIQRWWLSLGIEGAHHWNQAFLLELSAPLDLPAFERAIDRLLEHHDALRLRLHEGANGIEQIYAAPGGPTPLRVVDLASVPASAIRGAIEQASTEAQASLDLQVGPVMRAAYLDLGPARSPRLLLAVHHLAVDGVSWRILFEDLWSAYAQARAGDGPIALPPKTTSFQRWAERLVEHAESATLAAETEFWLEQDRRGAGRLPIDHETGPNDEASAKTVIVSLGAEDTEHLLRDVPAVYRTQINDVLLTAFVEAFAGWTGDRTVLVDLEGHGREELFADVDVTRTVGWFTALFPVVLALDDAHGPGEALKSVKEQLRAIPERGVGYGLLRYLCRGSDVGAELAAMPEAEVIFNYLGQFDQPTAGDLAPAPTPTNGAGDATPSGAAAAIQSRPAREGDGLSFSPTAPRSHLLAVNASVGSGRLHARFTYGEGRHRRETIEAFAAGFLDALRGIIAHCLSPEAGGATPSDFQKANLSQDMIDMLAGFDPGAGGDDDGEDDDDPGQN